MDRTPWTLWPTIAVLALVVGAAPASVPGEPWIDPFIADLNSPDIAVRDAAAKSLVEDPRLSLTVVESRLAEAARPLSVEQRERLLRLGRRLFIASPRAAMGVQFSRSDVVAGGVEIAGTVGGFDSQRVLRPGDLIRTIDGVPIQSQVSARCAIVSHEPGEEVAIELLRRGEAVVVRLRLGSFIELSNAAELGDATLDIAWNLRCDRMHLRPPSREVDAGLTIDRWAALREQDHEQRAARLQAERAGAAPADAGTPSEPMASAGSGLRTLTRGADQDFFLRERPEQAAQADRLRAQISMYRQQLGQLERQRKQPNLPAQQRRVLDLQIANTKRQIEIWREQLKLLAPPAQP